jgi:predicted permease
METIALTVYCLVAFGVSAAIHRYTKRFLVYVLASATAPALLLVIIDTLMRGYVESWAYVAFVGAWLIAFACALIYYFGRLLIDKRSAQKINSEPAEKG